MFTYICRSRFPMLICTDIEILEVYPNQIITSDIPINYPNLVLQENKYECIQYNPTEEITKEQDKKPKARRTSITSGV